jgi:hypothetical protein
MQVLATKQLALASNCLQQSIRLLEDQFEDCFKNCFRKTGLVEINFSIIVDDRKMLRRLLFIS